jgi:Mce-associated membrane protein
VPPPRRRPATPPTRRPKVAGLHRRSDQDELHDAADVETDVETADTSAVEAVDSVETHETVDAGQAPALDVPVIGEEPEREPVANGRPRPSAKRRDSGTVVTDRAGIDEPKHRKQDPVFPAQAEEPELDADSGLSDDLPEIEIDEEEAPRQASLTLPIVLVAVALLLGGLAFWFAQQLSDARVGSGNDALSDVNATKDVVGAAQQAVTSVLSYKFDDMQNSTTRAKEYLDGEAVGQYDASMKALEKEIQDQKLQVVVNPVSVGVVRMAGDDARVLVFADQIGARADKQPSGGPTQFAMDMHRDGGKWKIVKLDFFENR